LWSSYTELRSFLTSVANHEIEHINGDRYIPSGIRPIAEGGHLIQEGSYNIDINAETVDGKNTFHSLGRDVFQSKSVDDLAVCAERIKRGRDRSLPIDDTTSSLTNALSFTKPKSRVEPPRRTNVFDKIKCCYNGKRSTVDGIWIITRLLSRDVIQFPIHTESMTQTIPFWTEFHCLLSEKRPDVTVVAYPPIIDAKPTDMSTVFTAMKKCLDVSMDAGQEHAIQTFDQQLYAIAQQVKWSRPDIFEPHILRLGAFHSLSIFISSLGKMWAVGGLRDLLVDSGVFVGNTVEQMLTGKQFNRTVRGFTLVFETLNTLYIAAFMHWC
jgi:hypothetical protein